MTETTEYVLPKVWTWDEPSGGQFASINRPVAGPTHEARNDAVEGKAIIKPAANQRLDALDVVRRQVRAKLDLDPASGRQLQEQVIGFVRGNLRWRDDARQRRRHGCGLGRGERETSQRQRQQYLLQFIPPGIS